MNAELMAKGHEELTVEALERPRPVHRHVVEVFVIACGVAKMPENVETALKGWEILVHRLSCGHTMGPYLLRSDGSAPPPRLVCWKCQGKGARLRQGNKKNPTGTSAP